MYESNIGNETDQRPPRILQVKHADGDYALVPGEFRTELRHEVTVGRHHPPSSHRVGDFMRDFEQRYRFDKLGVSGRVVAMVLFPRLFGAQLAANTR